MKDDTPESIRRVEGPGEKGVDILLLLLMDTVSFTIPKFTL